LTAAIKFETVKYTGKAIVLRF